MLYKYRYIRVCVQIACVIEAEITRWIYNRDTSVLWFVFRDTILKSIEVRTHAARVWSICILCMYTVFFFFVNGSDLYMFLVHSGSFTFLKIRLTFLHR